VDAIEFLRKRYQHDYRRIYQKRGRIAFFDDLRRTAEAAGIPQWATFAAAMSAWLRGDLAAALELASGTVLLDPGFAYGWNGKGNVLQSLKRYDEAEADYRHAIELDPAGAHPWINLGNLLRRRKRFDEACRPIPRLFRLDPVTSAPGSTPGRSCWK
jgi:tetratricopeptide (TPR) repeat protein